MVGGWEAAWHHGRGELHLDERIVEPLHYGLKQSEDAMIRAGGGRSIIDQRWSHMLGKIQRKCRLWGKEEVVRRA